MDRFFDTVQLASLTTFLVLFIGRTIHLRFGRGVRVWTMVRGKPWPEAALELLFLVAFPIWLVEVLAGAGAISFELLPASVDPVLLGDGAWRAAGGLLQLAAIVIFAWSLLSFGDSWRVGVDRDSPGQLVTSGVFAWSRNPIFVSMDLFLLGAFLLDGGLFTLLFALGALLGFHRQILAEERFLAKQYGTAYERYCGRVSRYLGRTTRSKSAEEASPAS